MSTIHVSLLSKGPMPQGTFENVYFSYQFLNSAGHPTPVWTSRQLLRHGLQVRPFLPKTEGETKW